MTEPLPPAKRIREERQTRKAAAFQAPDEIAGTLVAKTRLAEQQQGPSVSWVGHARPGPNDPGAEVTSLANHGWDR